MKLRYKILCGILLFLAISIASLALLVSYDADCTPAPAAPDGAELIKAVVYTCYGSPDVLQLANVEKPVPEDDELLVKVHAVSVNPFDWHYMRGSPYVMRVGTGIGSPDVTRLGVDFAGTVEGVGSKVTKYKPGDEVFGGRNGAFAEYITAREDGARALKPANVSFEQAASVGIAAVTALQALRDKAKVQAGHKVLINGASGGVGTFAVQIAKFFGAEVAGVCSTRNVDMVRSIGADRVFDYTREDYTESGERYDVIIDLVGNHSLRANMRVLVADGTFVMVGAEQGDWVRPLMRPINAMLLSPFVDQQIEMLLAEFSADDLAFLAQLMAAGKVTPVIDRRYPFAEIAEAIRYSETGRARGKIVVSLGQ